MVLVVVVVAIAASGLNLSGTRRFGAYQSLRKSVDMQKCTLYGLGCVFSGARRHFTRGYLSPVAFCPCQNNNCLSMLQGCLGDVKKGAHKERSLSESDRSQLGWCSLLWVPDGHFCSKPYLSASDKVFLGSKEPFWVSPNWFSLSLE